MADSATNEDDTVQLGELVVCRTCAEATLEFLTVRQRPQVLLHTIAFETDEDNLIVDTVARTRDEKKMETGSNTTADDIIYRIATTTSKIPTSSTLNPSLQPSKAAATSITAILTKVPPITTPKMTIIEATESTTVLETTTSRSKLSIPFSTEISTSLETTDITTKKSPTLTTTTKKTSMEKETAKYASMLTTTRTTTTAYSINDTTASNLTAPSTESVVATAGSTFRSTISAPTTAAAHHFGADVIEKPTTQEVPSTSENITILDALTTTTEKPTTLLKTTIVEIAPTTEKPTVSVTTAAVEIPPPPPTTTTTEKPTASVKTAIQEKVETTEKPTTSIKTLILEVPPLQTTATVTTTTTTTTKQIEYSIPSKTVTTEKPTLLEKWTEPTGGVGLDRRIEDMESEITVPDPVSSGVSRVGRVTVIPTVITVNEASAALTDDGVTVTCEISNPHDWTSIVMTHTPVSQSDSEAQHTTTIVTLERTEPYATATVYSYRVRPTYDTSETKIRLSATITELVCSDHGVIECTLESRTHPRTSSVEMLSLTSPPSQPVLTAPLDALENREVTPAITCSTNDVGYPHWTLSLQAVLSTSDTPITVPTETRQFSNGKRCSHGVKLTLKGYLPVLVANGTMLVCELLSAKPVDPEKYRSHPGHSGKPDQVGTRSKSSEDVRDIDSLTDEQMLMVIRETICHNKGRKPSLIRHPYVCTRYIACEDLQPTIMACPPNQCFDPVSGNCGVQAVFLEPIHGALDEGLAGLACSIIHIRDWTRMRIRRHSWGAFYDDIVEVNAEGQVTWHDDSLRRRSLTDFRTSALPLLAELYIWIYELECADEDSYKCEVDREEEESMAGGHLLKVYARPSAPALVVPTTAVEDQGSEAVQITCEATLGRPRGTLTLKRKFHHEVEFRPVAFSMTTMQDVDTCLIRQKSFFTISKEEISNHNNSKWVCQVRPSEGTLQYLSYVASSEEQELYILPGDICKGQSHQFLQHPVYSCEHFLHCGRGETSVRTCRLGTCFNSITHWCDIPSPAKPKQCEMTTGYLPHEALCNKFIDCSGGKGTVERCPSGTVYATDGQCTTDIHESYCSKYIYGARSRS